MKNISYRAKLLLLLAIGNLALLAASIIYSGIVSAAYEEGREAFECLFQNVFPLYCPGCGGSRSLMFLLKFDIVNSFIYYPALPLAVIILIYFDITALISAIKNDPLILKKFKYGTLISIPVVILLNFAVKNILLHLFHIDLIGDFIL